ncbi:MAG TPA: hypothetical protein VLH12_12330, partial [Usitatibacter sp.]|nr:hypothetical protein [Usitatibacter sp.]
MSAPSWPPEVARAWVYHELLRRLGFRPGDLYVGVVRGDFAGAATRVVRVELRAQGREFGVHVAPWTAPRAAFEAAWTAFVAALRSGATTDADLQALWDAH